MKNNSSNMLFMTFMLMGLLMSISSSNWLGCWMGIEINLISFLPIMMDSMSVYSSESMIKYFIIQSMGSSLLFISILLFMMVNMNYMIMISLMIKMGCPPFHLWYPSVMEGLSWMGCFILSTIQKLAPLILLSYLYTNMIFFIILACCWGSIGGLNYSSLRKIIAYSSIYNLGWMISGINLTNYSWMIYFFIYMMILMMVCYLFNMLGMNYLNQFFFMSKNYMKSIMTMIIFMSMGGLPPFLGFIPKLILIYCLIQNNMLFTCLVLVLSALLVMFFYLRVVFTGLMINSISMKLKNQTLMWSFYVFGNINLFGLLMFSMLSLYF